MSGALNSLLCPRRVRSVHPRRLTHIEVAECISLRFFDLTNSMFCKDHRLIADLQQVAIVISVLRR